MNEQTKEQITAKAREFATAYTNRHFPNEPAFAFGNEGWAKFVDALVELAAPVVPAPVAQFVGMRDGKYVDSTPNLHVGSSSFEDWYQAHEKACTGDKQLARDAYAAGMGDPLVTYAQSPQAAPVAQLSEPPEGWKLVPIDPPPSMIAAGFKAAREYYERTGGNAPAIMYRAMLAAAPTTPKDAPCE